MGRVHRYRGAQLSGHAGCFRALPGSHAFPVREVHTDSGAEFLNAHLQSFWKGKYAGVFVTRTRPYHSQDNCFVEQRNGAPIRALVGHDRLDTAQQAWQLNHAYDILWS